MLGINSTACWLYDRAAKDFTDSAIKPKHFLLQKMSVVLFKTIEFAKIAEKKSSDQTFPIAKDVVR